MSHQDHKHIPSTYTDAQLCKCSAIHPNTSKKSQEGSSLYWGREEAPACANHQQVERGDPSLLLSSGESSGPRGPVLGSQLQKGHGHTGENETEIPEDVSGMG